MMEYTSAQSLSEGSGYRIVSLPGQPPQTKYPILYSYILSWVWSVSQAFPRNITILKSVNVVCLFFIALITYEFYCVTVPEAGTDGYL
jgi:hypothetical protein